MTNVFERMSGLAVRSLRPEQLQRLRNRYHAGRTALHPLMRAVQRNLRMPPSLRRHLEHRVGRDFEILLVHSSVNNMSPMFTEGPLEMLRMLIADCGPERTLVMPAYFSSGIRRSVVPARHSSGDRDVPRPAHTIPDGSPDRAFPPLQGRSPESQPRVSRIGAGPTGRVTRQRA